MAFDPANTRVRVGFRDGAGVERGATSVVYETQTVLGSYGGILFYAGTTVGLQPDDAWAPVEVLTGDLTGGGKVVSYFNGEKSLIGNDVTTFESVLPSNKS